MWFMLAAAYAGLNVTAESTADADGDGRAERVIAGFEADGSIRVAVVEADGHATQIDLGPRFDVMGARDRLEIDITPASETGVPLVHVYLPGGEYCGSGDTHIYVAYRQEGPRAEMSKALEYASFSDAPIWSVTEATFRPDQRAVVVTSESGELDQTQMQSTEILHYRDGAFVR